MVFSSSEELTGTFEGYIAALEAGDMESVTATVDRFLPDGTTSRERVVASFEGAGDAGSLVMVDYEVLDVEQIG